MFNDEQVPASPILLVVDPTLCTGSVAVCCNVLQCVAAPILLVVDPCLCTGSVAVCCNVLQLQCVAMCCSVLQVVLQCVAVCCSADIARSCSRTVNR